SIVRLQVIPKDAGIDGAIKEITIVRNKVKLEEQQAKKSIIEIPNGMSKAKIGVITIPMFYMDFAAYAAGDKDFRSTTRDTQKLIDELVAEKVEGILIDLRNNGGGSLVEAVSLTGLFIKSGPVVQVRNKSGKIDLNEDEDPSIAYTGPLSVLVNRYSASASEIFAGAMQDYGRATIIGEPTYGKGTVQSIVDLNRYVDEGVTLGKLKLTMAQFFRVNGDSTQHRGVVPDIVFPTANQGKNQGESSLENALPWANIKSAKFSPYAINDINLDDIKTNHKNRIAKDDGFKFLLAELEERSKIMDKKELTLQKAKRKAERESMEKIQKNRLNQFRVSRGMKPVEKAASNDDDEPVDEKLKDELDGIEVREAAAIMIDVISSSQNKLAQHTK
ncbi:MAG: carboxy terminal-processing peptidase, partial [Gammaproteobacteria bacterium]|nr:carboxy terminal-processing peptidase [Gammaproteobacteria bacterium]